MDPLQARDVLDRLRDYPHDSYLYLGSILKGVALYFAFLVGLEILYTAWTKHDCARIVPWFASFAAVVVSYMKWGRGVLLTDSPADLWDTIWPLSMGLAEFFLFALLSPQLFLPRPDALTFPTKSPWWPSAWFGALALQSVFAVLLIRNRICQTDPNLDFSSDLKPLAITYIGWMTSDAYGASATGALALLISLCVWRRKPKSEKVRKAIVQLGALFFLFGLSFIAWQANSERDEIAKNQAVIKAAAQRAH